MKDPDDAAAHLDLSVARRRTRASKPKVRTGCLTCKIRRVKCGEEKPACLRCTSTGRTCDGYDKGAPSRHRTQETLRSLEIAKREFLKTYQWNDAFRSMRPLIADIDGTETERRFFHKFRTVSSGGLANHVLNFTDFFARICPQMSHQDEAVKHAMVALGAAYHQFQIPEGASPTDCDEVEVFTIEQYTKSLSKLQKHVASPSDDSTRLFLVCCLAFICLESLRSNHTAALTHLRNGLNIIGSLPDCYFEFLADDNKASRGVYSGDLDMQDIIMIFARLEISASFFADQVKPVIAIKSYNLRKMYDGSEMQDFKDLWDVHKQELAYFRDIHGRMYETDGRSGDLEFWSRPEESAQQFRLAARTRKLELLFKRFMSSPKAPRPGTSEYFSLHVDWLHFRCASLFLNGMTGLDPETLQAKCPEPAKSDQAIIKEMFVTGNMLYQNYHKRSRTQKARGYTYDAGIVGPLYYVSISSEDATIRNKSLKLLREIHVREGFWDGPEMQNLVKQVGQAIEGEKWPFEEVPRTLTGLGSVPGIYDTLARLDLSSDSESPDSRISA